MWPVLASSIIPQAIATEDTTKQQGLALPRTTCQGISSVAFATITSSGNRSGMDFDLFLTGLEEYLPITDSSGARATEATPIEELGWDSLDLAVVADLLFTANPDAELAMMSELTHLGDVYHYCCLTIGSGEKR